MQGGDVASDLRGLGFCSQHMNGAIPSSVLAYLEVREGT